MLAGDVVYAVRSMRKNPGFTAVAVLSLALGIGANLAVFSVLHRLVLTRLPVRAPDQLYQLVVMQANGTHYTNPYPKFVIMRDNFDVFKPLLGWGGFRRSVIAGEWKDQARVTAVTGNYFDALGVRPVLGRLIAPEDEQSRASEIAVISHRFWQTAFAGEAGVLGRTARCSSKCHPSIC